MGFFRNLSLRMKIILVVLLFFILEVAVGSVAILFLNQMNVSLAEIADVETERVKLTAAVHRDLLEIHRAQKNIVLSPDRANFEKYSLQISQFDKELKENVTKLTTISSAIGQNLLERFMTDYEAFMKVNDQVISFVYGQLADSDAEEAARTNSEAVGLSQGPGRNAFNTAVASLNPLYVRTDVRLKQAKDEATGNVRMAIVMIAALSVFSATGGLIAGLLVARSIVSGLGSMAAVADAVAGGNLETQVSVESQDEVGKLAGSINRMQNSLLKARDESRVQDWLKTGIMRLNDVMRGELDVACLSSKVISEIATYLDAQVGAFYMLDGKGNGPVLSLLSSYAYTKRKNLSNEFKPGEGLVGQAALEKKQILVSNVPEEYVKVTSGLGEASPRSITVTPFLYESRVSGVVEIGTLGQMSGTQLEYLSQAMNSVAINVETARGREELAKALKESRALAEKLQVQQEELKAANEELEEQTQMLQQSEEKLKLQQEELKVANEELEEKNESLERQKSKIEQANKDLERTRKEIETKAEELGIASKYKSEFLANMSHELRTPLNSLLLLARLLADNKEGNLSKEQMESAGIIYNSGNDLLSLLNEILDLSKIEAGRMDVHVEPVSVATLAEAVRAGFEHVAADKGLSLEVTVSENAPAEISTDRKRLEQIIKNLMSNAIKFTEKGAVTVNFGRPDEDADLSRSGLVREKAFAISVKDTGIGISPKDQKIIFEAFQQAEGGSSRKFGGTGLGLTISRELAALLGGEIQLESEVGKGTVFTVCLPLGPPDFAKVAHEAHTEKPVLPGRGRTARQKKAVVESVPDDRECVKKEDKVILIVEDDPNFARLLQKQCHDKGFKCLASATGEGGLELAEKYSPAAIVLDLKLPGIDGWTVLDTLKENPKTRHIPVHIMSVEDATIEAFRKGAVGYLTKPAKKEDLEEAFQRLEAVFSRRVKDLIVVEDDGNMRKGIIKLVGNGDVYAEEAATGGQALQALKSRKFDCMILDLGLPDMTGFELLKALEAEENVVIPPVIVYTGKELTHEEEMELRKYSESIIIKGVRSEERLLDESSLFLHRMVDKLPENMRKIITNLHDVDVMFKNRRVMIVDDDMRNVFALTSVLEQKGVSVLKAENGQKALEMLLTEPKVDLVLMDIMMPVMDGYETMKRIRAQEKFQKLPIIALTAKAMREDRERSITAGASDYLTKPVDVSRLCSMMRVWLYK